jgi:PAS domain S-box-containing protein
MLKSLLRAAPVGIGLVANGILGWTNAEMQQMTGYSGEELAGQCSRMLYETDEEFRRVGSEQYAQIEADGVGSAETRFRRKDGRVIDVLLSSAALDFENLSAGVVFTALDITERRRSEKRAIEQDARLAHLERLSTMGEMAAGIAHELNQPLSAIMNYAEACKLGLTSRVASPEELLENVEAVAVQAQRAGGIIQHVRQFTKLHEPARSPEDLRALITEAAQFLEREARVKDVWIRLELPAEPLRVPVDPVLIQQVVVNLLRNGLDAVSGAEVATRVVTVRATPEARGVVVTVRDNGGGVSPEVMGRLFDPFFTTKQLGLGMGLAISRSIVEAHGGSLSAELNPDRGMTFRMTLPTVAEAEAKHD